MLLRLPINKVHFKKEGAKNVPIVALSVNSSASPLLVSVPLFLSLSLSLSLSLFLCFSLSFSVPLFLSLSLFLCFSLSVSLGPLLILSYTATTITTEKRLHHIICGSYE